MRDSGRRDPGLQPERTRLAWRRTVLSATVSVAMTVRAVQGGPSGEAVRVAVTALCLLPWLLLLALPCSRPRPCARWWRGRCCPGVDLDLVYDISYDLAWSPRCSPTPPTHSPSGRAHSTRFRHSWRPSLRVTATR
ncbi:DUF202 domain-containing protein [Streptomyces sp. NPDC008343]|uniref:DUF202 domain-containing protein n=1 Tax=Streptomyces sp. NPDC008343 TaxID=3364828 RepID=UPI0036F01497